MFSTKYVPAFIFQDNWLHHNYFRSVFLDEEIYKSSDFFRNCHIQCFFQDYAKSERVIGASWLMVWTLNYKQVAFDFHEFVSASTPWQDWLRPVSVISLRKLRIFKFLGLFWILLFLYWCIFFWCRKAQQCETQISTERN